MSLPTSPPPPPPWPFCASDLHKYTMKLLNLATQKVETKHPCSRSRILHVLATLKEHNFKAPEIEISRNQNLEILLFLDKLFKLFQKANMFLSNK